MQIIHHMQTRFTYLLVMLFAAAFFSCTKSDTSNPSSGILAAYSFAKENNEIPLSSTATISGQKVTIFLPPGTDRRGLVASFSLTDSAAVTVNGIPQQSDVTANDFSEPLTYTISYPNGSSKTFTVTLITDIASIDENVSDFMSTYHVPGLSIAITKDERLVYVKSYGYADIEDNQLLKNTDRFRLASVSKQITSAAIMRLYDEGLLKPEDKVFGPDGILGNTYGTRAYSDTIKNITIDHLLHHTCGGWSNSSDVYPDPMFVHPKMSHAQLITWTLDNIPLVNNPGDHYDYSNFGYCLLGRIVEKITGKTYADAAKELVLQPCDIADMRIGGNTLAERAPNEVKYYGQQDEDPYDMNVMRMDSHGGWIATATDLAKFLLHMDGTGGIDILSPDALTKTMTGSTANPNYGCGWVLTQPNWWHNGSLPGTGTEQGIIKQDGHYNFVILTNTRSNTGDYGGDMDNIFWSSVKATTAWPTYDLLDQ